MSILANGQVSTSKDTIFEVAGTSVRITTKVEIEKVVVFNTGSTSQTVILYVKERNSSSIKIRQFVLQENESGEYLEPGESLPLDIGDAIEAETTTASTVDFVIFGKRE